MTLSKYVLGMVTAGGMLAGAAGCHGGGGSASSSSPAATQPTTMPIPETNMRNTGPQTMPVAPASAPATPSAAAPAEKDMTHVLAKDEPYFTDSPGPSATPAGTLAAGSKVLVMVPGAEYTQVVTDKGVSAYTPTDGLKPIGK